MIDPKPMRIEDELAMQEELRRLRALEARLEAAVTDRETSPTSVGKKKGLGRLEKTIVAFLVLSLVGVMGDYVVVRYERSMELGKEAEKTKRDTFETEMTRGTPCYFVGHAVGGERWDPWYVFRLVRRDRTATAVERQIGAARAPVIFTTPEEARAFVKQWDLKVCQ